MEVYDNFLLKQKEILIKKALSLAKPLKLFFSHLKLGKSFMPRRMSAPLFSKSPKNLTWPHNGCPLQIPKVAVGDSKNKNPFGILILKKKNTHSPNLPY